MTHRKEDLKRLFIYGMTFTLIVGSIYLAVAMVIQLNTNEVRRKEVTLNEERLVKTEKQIIYNKINRLITDVLYISDMLDFTKLDAKGMKELEQRWKSFSNRKEACSQIRFIDTTGQEIICVKNEGTMATIVPQKQLINKKDRDYFESTMRLKKGVVYISKMELNKVNDIIQTPIEPILRISTPYYDRSGKLRGIVILNYKAEDMLRQVKSVANTSQGQIMMLNGESFWLYNEQAHEKEWAFMYNKNSQEKYVVDHSEFWKKMLSEESGSISDEHCSITYQRLLCGNIFEYGNRKYEISFGERQWILLSAIVHDNKMTRPYQISFEENLWHVVWESPIVYLAILIFAGVFGCFMVTYKKSREKVKFYSEYDTMTGVFNRRAGFTAIQKAYKDAMKNEKSASICFLDINGLKAINDHLGHESGDELIVSVVEVIQSWMKSQDILMRLGGDEFLVLFYGLSEEESEERWERISAQFQQINTTENRKYLLSVSHGIKEFTFLEDENIDIAINLADEKMYQEKKTIKEELQILK